MNLLRNFFALPLLMEVVHEMAVESLKQEECKCCHCKELIEENKRCVSNDETPKTKFTTAPKCETSEKSAFEYTPDFTREPDGVDIHVDRPRRENYYSHKAWAKDMAEYRMLIDQAKKCDWPCREPLQGVPSYVHNNRRDWYDEKPHLW